MNSLVGGHRIEPEKGPNQGECIWLALIEIYVEVYHGRRSTENPLCCMHGMDISKLNRSIYHNVSG